MNISINIDFIILGMNNCYGESKGLGFKILDSNNNWLIFNYGYKISMLGKYVKSPLGVFGRNRLSLGVKDKLLRRDYSDM